MKKITLGLGLLFIGAFANAQVGLDSIIVEKYYVANAADAAGSVGTLPVGSVTYRVFVDLAAGYEFQSLFGILDGDAQPLHTLKVSTTTSFFNNVDFGSKKSDILSGNLKKNTVALDSWFSIGGAAGGQIGVLKSEDDGAANLIHTGRSGASAGILTNTVTTIGIPLTTQDGMMAGSPEAVQVAGTFDGDSIFANTSQLGGTFSTSDGTVYSLNGAVGPTATNRVLIGQFTTDGIFHFELNIQVGLSTGSGGVEKYVASNPQPGEYTHASLTYTSPSAGPNVAPTVSITSPLSSATITATSVVATADAIDTDGVIDSVAFFVDGVKIGIAASAPFSYTLTGLAKGTHTLTAIATDNSGSSTTSSPVTFEIITTGINDITVSGATVLVYPNPTTNFTTLDINTIKENKVNYTIYNGIGNIILTKDLGTINGNFIEKIDLSTFSSGFYFIGLSIDGIISTKKIILN